MKSASIMKVLKYLDLSIRRCVELHKSGDTREALERLAMLESICTRTLWQIEKSRRLMENQKVRSIDARSMENDMMKWLSDLPTAEGEHG